MPQPSLTARDVAKLEQVKVGTVLGWLQRGELPGYKLPGGDWRIAQEAYERWREQLGAGVQQPVTETQ